MKNIRFFLSENFQFLVVKFSIYLNRRVLVMNRFPSYKLKICRCKRGITRLQKARGIWSRKHKALEFSFLYITKTYLYNFAPIKPHFYIVKLGFTGCILFFLNSAQKHRLWVLVRTASARGSHCEYSLEPHRRGGSNEYPQFMFWAEIWKISDLFIWKLSVFGGEIFNIFE